MDDKRYKAKRIADQFPDQARTPDQAAPGANLLAQKLTQLMIDFLNMILSLFTGYRIAGGSNYQKPTARQIAGAAIADEVRKDAAADQPERVLDRPFEIRRVARRLSRGEDPVTAKLSVNVLAALQVMPKADLKAMTFAPDDVLSEFADGMRKMAIEPKQEPANEKAADNAAALEVDPVLSKRMAMRRQVEAGEEVDYEAWFAEEPVSLKA
jgi:hypothetical protein